MKLGKKVHLEILMKCLIVKICPTILLISTNQHTPCCPVPQHTALLPWSHLQVVPDWFQLID